MSEERIAGQYLAVDIDRLMEVSAKVSTRELACRQLGEHLRHKFPACEGCKNLELMESQDHVRYAIKYAVTCKNRPRHSGAMMTCPDGFMGIFDEEKKKVIEVKRREPELKPMWPTFDPSAPMISMNDEFLKEYMTTPSIAEENEGVMKRLVEEKIKLEAMKREEFLRKSMLTGAMLEERSEGISKISAGLDDLLGKRGFATGRPAGVKAAPKANRDLPATADGDAW